MPRKWDETVMRVDDVIPTGLVPQGFACSSREASSDEGSHARAGRWQNLLGGQVVDVVAHLFQLGRQLDLNARTTEVSSPARIRDHEDAKLGPGSCREGH